MVFARFVVSSLNGVWLKLWGSFDLARASFSGLHACSLELSLDSCVLWADDLVPVRLRITGLGSISGAAPGQKPPPACSIIGILDRKNDGFCKIRGLKSQWRLAEASDEL